MAAESPFDHRQFETVFAGYFPWCQPTLPIRVCRRVYLPLQPAILGRTATASPAGSCCCPYADFKSCCVNLRGNFPNGKKPEKLIRRIIDISSKPGDIVLDSFLGSCTTAAVAHKMGRRYIGIEIGEHAKTHCQPRLKQVVDNEQGGISKAVEWKGGGGFRFCK